MYGYVVVNQQELKIREYTEYRSYYCGLCRSLKEALGVRGQMSISYDMTFLVLLLTGLYEPEVKYYKRRCIAHPLVKCEIRRSECSDYVADMNILMTYYKCMDDWNDERKLLKKIYGDTLKSKVLKIEKKYPKKSELIKRHLDNLSELEKNNEKDVRTVVREFGAVMAQICAYRDDEWQQTLMNLGDALGQYIYLLDAYDDAERDAKTGSYNVLMQYWQDPGFDNLCEAALKDIMARAAREFEYLPIINNAEILKNILYSGVWTRFDIAQSRRNRTKK